MSVGEPPQDIVCLSTSQTHRRVGGREPAQDLGAFPLEGLWVRGNRRGECA